MGYKKVITYILDSECGASLKASGFVCEGPAGDMEWTGRSKPRDNGHPVLTFHRATSTVY